MRGGSSKARSRQTAGSLISQRRTRRLAAALSVGHDARQPVCVVASPDRRRSARRVSFGLGTIWFCLSEDALIRNFR
jgi:hypothetical protein